MKKITMCWSIALMGFAAIAAPLGRIYPEPQKILSEAIDFPVAANKVNVILHSSSENNQLFDMGKRLYIDALAQLADSALPTQLEIHAGVLENPEIRKMLNYEHILLPPQGYAIKLISSTPEKAVVVIGGIDERGILYGFCSLAQLLFEENNSAVQRIVDVQDYPVWRERFISDYIAHHSMEGYMQAISNKVGSTAAIIQDNWRKPEWWEKSKPIFDSMKTLHDAGAMNFMVLLHIYSHQKTKKQLNIANDAEVDEVIESCRKLAKSGVTYIMIGADDITPLDLEKGYVAYHQEETDRFGSIGAAHGYLMKRLYESLNPEFPDLKLSMVGAPYSVDHGLHRPVVAQYMKDWGKNAPREVMWVWTGKGVFSPHVNSDELKKFTDLLSGQKLYLFDNSNGFYSPLPRWETKFYPGMEVDNEGLIYLNGCYFQTNNRNQETLRFLTSCDYLWNPEKYDPKRSYDTALEILFGAESIVPVNRLREIMISYDDAEYSGDRESLIATADEFAAALAEVEKLHTADGNQLALGLERIRTRVERAKTFENYVAPEVNVYAANQPIVLDGDLSDAAWKNASIITLEEDKAKPGEALSTPSTVRISYSPEGIYLAFDMPITQPLPEIAALRHDDAAYGSPEAVEIFLQFVAPGKDNLGSYAHYCFDYEGNKFEESTVDILGWNGDWQLAVKKNDNSWSAEVFIRPTATSRSFYAIQNECIRYTVEGNPGIEAELPKSGMIITANFHRVINREGKVQSWGRGGFMFHLPGYFGNLNLK